MLLGEANCSAEDWEAGRAALERVACLIPLPPSSRLALAEACVARGVPLFGVCRGLQEMNVAFGGTLHQKLYEQPGLRDHREDKTQPLDLQYAPAHDVELTDGGMLQRLAPWREAGVPLHPAEVPPGRLRSE